ncbi:MAG: virulence RhuM family protein [Aliidiomarina sp.]|uniref:virulence RhuM family protein n=1 Tax=Aliidiomarina sp. TaxID=1872439 RepID=UPI0025C50C0A|nr:RhuM family protein [Aliidiomarina sp.]MCH8501734.1 virulence RhuM family protein [Aliidiomarina sp.]
MKTQSIKLFTSADGKAQLEVALEQETVWLSQDQMAELFGKANSTVNEHIKNIFIEKELDESDVMKKFGNSEFAKKPTNFYDLDVIISVGYRVKSQRGVQFRKWTTQTLKDHLIQVCTHNQRRLEERGIEFQQALDLATSDLVCH